MANSKLISIITNAAECVFLAKFEFSMNRGSAMKRILSTRISAVIVLTAMLIAPIASVGQTTITAPKNKYGVQDDVKLGNDNAALVEKQFPILNDADATRYVERVGRRLVANIPPEFRRSEFNYRFKIVNASDINAFALPGGPMFVNRGMIEAARSEGEMAGVMAHEISHVALRHATAQQTKQSSVGNQLGVIGLVLGGYVLGGNAGAQMGAIGAAAWMTKYSREYETQADMLGAQIMASAGYDPRDLANMFKTIESQSKGGAPEWLSSHPDPGNRYENINREAQALRIAPGGDVDAAQFRRIQERFRSLPPAKTMAEIQKTAPAGGGTASGGTYSATVAAPSSRTKSVVAGGIISMSVPSNWTEINDPDSTQYAPEGAYGSSGITRGAIVGAVNSQSTDLARASQDQVDVLLNGNSYLRKTTGYTSVTIGGRRGLSISLAGISPVTHKNEQVNIYTFQGTGGTFYYIATVAPANEAYRYTNAFRRLVNSVRFSN